MNTFVATTILRSETEYLLKFSRGKHHLSEETAIIIKRTTVSLLFSELCCDSSEILHLTDGDATDVTSLQTLMRGLLWPPTTLSKICDYICIDYQFLAWPLLAPVYLQFYSIP